MKNQQFFFVIDAGNTEIVFALIKNFKIYKIVRIKTSDLKRKVNTIFKSSFNLKKILLKQKKIICIISSVVDEINNELKKKCIFFLKQNPHFVSYNNTNLNININIKKKNQVGADRIVNSVAIKSFYKKPAVVIDFGTTTTFDVINNRGDYIGGLITPGINLSLLNLNKKTSKLPLVKFKKKRNVIGKNTIDAIENGVYWGYVGLISFIIKKIQSNFKKKLFCISTGGLSKIISRDISSIDIVNQNLTILGLIEIFKLNYEQS